MHPQRRILAAILICLVPSVAFGLIYAFGLRPDRYGDRMGFSVVIMLPAVVLGLPWTLVTALTEAVLKEAATFINFALIAIAYLFNVWWALGKWSFTRVSTIIWIVTSVQCLAYFAFR